MLDPRISLATTVPDMGRTFSNILTNVGKMDAIRENRDNRPFRDQLMQQNVSINEQNLEQGQGKLLDERSKRRLVDLAQFASQAKPYFGSPQGIEQLKTVTMERIANLNVRRANGEDVDASESEQFLQALNSDPALAERMVDQTIQLGSRQHGQKNVANSKMFANGTSVSIRRDGSKVVSDSAGNILTGESAQIAVDAGIQSDVDLSGSKKDAVNISDLNYKPEITSGTEGAKLNQQLKFKPLIGKAVKLAEAEAKQQGETWTSYKRAKAALPGLQESVNQLRSLAPIATSTWGGRVFDAAVKETGFGATKGATARAKFIAIINNQVLPLLKETFGAAFTEKEGETLKATMGDPNSTEEEKMAQLDAFIEQKIRTLEAQERELNDTSTIQGINPSEMSDEDLFN